MAVQFTLAENDRVLVYTFIGHWEIDELVDTLPHTYELVEKTGKTVHLLIDLSQTPYKTPKNIFRTRAITMHPKIGQIVFLGTSAFSQMLAQAIFKLMHVERFKFFEAPEQAWAYLRQLIADEPLPSTQPAEISQ